MIPWFIIIIIFLIAKLQFYGKITPKDGVSYSTWMKLSRAFSMKPFISLQTHLVTPPFWDKLNQMQLLVLRSRVLDLHRLVHRRRGPLQPSTMQTVSKVRPPSMGMSQNLWSIPIFYAHIAADGLAVWFTNCQSSGVIQFDFDVREVIVQALATHCAESFHRSNEGNKPCSEGSCSIILWGPNPSKAVYQERWHDCAT